MRGYAVGTETVWHGLVWRKIEVYGVAQWQRVNRLNWEAVNGPLPAGFALKSLDGNAANDEASNWIPISLELSARSRAILSQTPPELAETVIALEMMKLSARRFRAVHGIPDPVKKQKVIRKSRRQYEQHKARMKADPVYAEESRREERERGRARRERMKLMSVV